jgi:hypothetical protein
MLIIHHPHDKYILIAIALWLAIWVYLVIKALRISRKQIKQIEHDHYKNVKATLLEPVDIPGEDLDLFECQHPHIEYRAGCN